MALAPTVAGAAAPDEWDRRVAPFVRFVERTRGLEFEQPVPVRFLDDDEFVAAAADWYTDITDEDRELAALDAADLLALGLVDRPVDLIAAEEASDATDLLGWYDDVTDEMVVRGTDLDDTEVVLTVVHELVHALQDQHFDLEALEEAAETSGQQAGLDALVEGDASRVELEYLWSLPQKVQDAYWGEGAPGSVAAVDDAAEEWPLVLDLWDVVAYDFGPTVLDIAIAANGRRAVDQLFRSPPMSEEQVIDPVALEDDDEPREVALPGFAADERAVGPVADWGAYSWYLLLASRIPWRDALDAVEGWGGDQYASYVRTVDGVEQPCVRLAVVGDTARDGNELEDAIAAWSAAMPAGTTAVQRDGEIVVLSACTTGAAVTSVDDRLQDAYDRLWERTDQMWYMVDRRSPADPFARCVADELVDDPATRKLLYLEREPTRAEQRTFDRTFGDAVDTCP